MTLNDLKKLKLIKGSKISVLALFCRFFKSHTRPLRERLGVVFFFCPGQKALATVIRS
jgi:hypothetical protein